MADSETELPAFTHGSSLLENAVRIARAAHDGPGHGETEIGHPVAVAELLSEAGFEATVVAAALLHDTVEDTPLTTKEIGASFGPEVATLVAEMTEDPSIEAYPAQKSEARRRGDVEVSRVGGKDRCRYQGPHSLQGVHLSRPPAQRAAGSPGSPSTTIAAEL